MMFSALSLQSVLFLLHTRELHDAAPLLDFGASEGCELLGRPRLGHDADAPELFAHRLRAQDVPDVAIQPLDDRLRRAARGIDSIPRSSFDARHAAFCDGGNFLR